MYMFSKRTLHISQEYFAILLTVDSDEVIFIFQKVVLSLDSPILDVSTCVL